MEPVDLRSIPDQALLLIDSAPIIYVIENNKRYAARFLPVFEAHAAGRVRFAITTAAIAEVLTGPLRTNDEVLLHRYRAILSSWQIVDFDLDIAEGTARLRASLNLKFSDAIQAASALAINAYALITHDRDFSRVRLLRVMG